MDALDPNYLKFVLNEVKLHEMNGMLYMASLKENDIEASNVLNIYKIKKEDGKIYKFKVDKGGEKMKFIFDASGKLLHTRPWALEGVTSAL